MRRRSREPELPFEPLHESFQRRRTERDAERVYAELWAARNSRDPAINRGFTLAEWILCPERHEYPDRITLRDARVLASFAQWLGTNGGQGFVQQAESIIEQVHFYRREIGSEWHVVPALVERARILATPAKPFMHERAWEAMVTEIARALAHARVVWHEPTPMAPRGILLSKREEGE